MSFSARLLQLGTALFIGLLSVSSGALISGCDSGNSGSTSTDGSTYHVDPSGRDGQSGSKDQPFATLHRASRAASGGDTVIVHGGVYVIDRPVEIQNTGRPNAWVTFRGAEGEEIVLNAEGIAPESPGGEGSEYLDMGAIHVQGVHHVRLENLTVRQSPNIGIMVEGANPRWGTTEETHHIDIVNCASHGSYGSGIAVWYGDEVRVLRNEVTGANDLDLRPPSNDEAPDEAPHEGITFAGATNFEAAYNSVHDSDKEGIDVKEVSAHGTVHNNHLYELPRQGLYVDSWFGLLEDVEVYANRVHDCEWGVVISAEGEDSRMENVRVHHNLLYDNRASGVYFGTWGNDVQRSEIYIYNNTVHDNGTSGHWAGPTGGIDLRSKSLQDVYIFNNIASQNWAFEIATFVPPADIPDSLVHRNITIAHNLSGKFKSRTDEEGLYRTVYGYRGQEAVEGDPLFQNAEAGNFRLRDDSPAIGAGTTNWKPSTSSADLGAIPQNPSPADSTILPPGAVSP